MYSYIAQRVQVPFIIQESGLIYWISGPNSLTIRYVDPQGSTVIHVYRQRTSLTQSPLEGHVTVPICRLVDSSLDPVSNACSQLQV